MSVWQLSLNEGLAEIYSVMESRSVHFFGGNGGCARRLNDFLDGRGDG
jgi:hypothetical protein